MIKHFLIGPTSNQESSLEIPVFLDRNLFQKMQEISGNFVFCFVLILVVKLYFTRYFLHFLIIGTFIEKLSL